MAAREPDPIVVKGSSLVEPWGYTEQMYDPVPECVGWWSIVGA